MKWPVSRDARRRLTGGSTKVHRSFNRGFSSRTRSCPKCSFEELRHRRDGGSPVSPQERIVHIIGQDKALDLHAFREEPAFEIDGLMKIHGAIVIAVDQQDR